MMNQINFNNQEGYKIEKMNLLFEIKSDPQKSINIICNFGTKIKDALEMFSAKIGKN